MWWKRSPKIMGMAAAQGFQRSTGNSTRAQHRHLATSAQKRKWDGKQKPSKKDQNLSLSEETTNAKKPKDDGNPFLFLVVFPVVMTGLVVVLREDLRDELRSMVPGSLLQKSSPGSNREPESKENA
jgi:hypothetical protein